MCLPLLRASHRCAHFGCGDETLPLLCLCRCAACILCRCLAPSPYSSPPTVPCLAPPAPQPASPQATLRDSVSLLLLRLLDDGGLLHFEEGATLVKAVNVLMLKILEARWAGCGQVWFRWTTAGTRYNLLVELTG